VTTRPDARGIAVVKLGGSTLGQHDTSLADIAAAHASGRPLVVVHGGGAAVSAWLARSGAEARFVRGLRATDAPALEVVIAVLAGILNTQLVAALGAAGAPAVGLTGADAALLQARRYDEDLGFVGRIERVEPAILRELLEAGRLPVIAPIAVEPGSPPQLLNTNADTAAGEIAAALGAESLVFLTDVEAVRDASGAPLAHLTADAARALIADGTAAGGMAPKLEAATRAATAGCATRIVDGTQPGALARALAGAPGGTVIGA
jgi:acetylglutamate kinase